MQDLTTAIFNQQAAGAYTSAVSTATKEAAITAVTANNTARAVSMRTPIAFGSVFAPDSAPALTSATGISIDMSPCPEAHRAVAGTFATDDGRNVKHFYATRRIATPGVEKFG